MMADRASLGTKQRIMKLERARERPKDHSSRTLFFMNQGSDRRHRSLFF